jgi:phosphatidylserine/phosphatidylglycerophosphate/cardiolipin synthase-like enzyme
MSLTVCLGRSARDALCAAFDGARHSIDAEYYSIGDPDVVASLNAAAARGVRVRVVVEGEPHRFRRRSSDEPAEQQLRGGLSQAVDVIVSRAAVEVHGKAAVIDGTMAAIGTANPVRSGCGDPGDVIVFDRVPADVATTHAFIGQAENGEPSPHRLRDALAGLLDSSSDLRIASEDLSDWRVARMLLRRAHDGHRDRIIVNRKPSAASRKVLKALERAGVDVRTVERGHMHEKYVDSGDRIYIGSGNLTRNGIDEAHEIGIVAVASDFADGAAALRDDFDRQWAACVPAIALR